MTSDENNVQITTMSKHVWVGIWMFGDRFIEYKKHVYVNHENNIINKLLYNRSALGILISLTTKNNANLLHYL